MRKVRAISAIDRAVIFGGTSDGVRPTDMAKMIGRRQRHAGVLPWYRDCREYACLPWPDCIVTGAERLFANDVRARSRHAALSHRAAHDEDRRHPVLPPRHGPGDRQ